MLNPHTLEKVMGHPLTQGVFRYITKRRDGGRTLFGDALLSYAGRENGLPWEERIEMLPLKAAVGALRRWGFKVSDQVMGEKILSYPYNLKALVNTLRSVGQFGLTKPQKFSAPLLVVWNFTNACNLRCRHCYQKAGKPWKDELSLQQKMEVVDQLADADVPVLAFSGGEPLMGEGFYEVAKYAKERGFYLSLATNGTSLTKDVANRLFGLGIDYIQISLDSIDPGRHDRFRGKLGAWKMTIEGIKNAIAAKGPGSSVGIATVLTRWNYGEVDDMVQLAIDLGADVFYAYNFVPVGKGAEMVAEDLTPQQRETVLHSLYRYMAEEKISVLTTSPQFGRVCIMDAPGTGRIVLGHYGTEAGEKARVLVQYIGGCGAGRAYCGIEPNGVVTPCVFMKLPVGDLRKQRFMDIWNGSPVMQKLRDRRNLEGYCRVCEYRSVCGGCRARAYNYFGDYLGADPGCINNLTSWRALKAEEAPRFEVSQFKNIKYA